MPETLDPRGMLYDEPPVEPRAVLNSRSARAARQRALLGRGGCALVSFTLNLPGAHKQFTAARAAHAEGMRQLALCFAGHILYAEDEALPTGSEGYLGLDLDPLAAKRMTVELEEWHPLGRLFDMDVLGADAVAIPRAALGLPPRRCLVCGQNAKLCARGQRHPPAVLQQRVAELLQAFFCEAGAGSSAACAARALLYEVSTTPKPGLVDRNNNGAHRDMDFFTFLDSSAALTPFFGRFYREGWAGAARPAAELFLRLRFVGREAEQAMLQATGGVNTHKGLIFSLGILCAALGAEQANRWGAAVPQGALLARCCTLGACAMADFDAALPLTNGLRSYRTCRVTGARGQAAAGFPAVVEVALPKLRQGLAAGLSINDAAALTLAALLAAVEDTNMIHRGGAAEASRCRAQVRALAGALRPGAAGWRQTLCALDALYIETNMSPGGCADLLAVSLFLLFAEQGGLIVPENERNEKLQSCQD